jgi:pyruvate carboxylase
VLDPAVDVAFPDSVVQLFRGELGQPTGGFPANLQSKVLGGQTPLLARPGDHLSSADIEAERNTLQARLGRSITEDDLASHLMYPKVFEEYVTGRVAYGDVSALPTAVFFYGMQPGKEINIDIERGKTLIVRYVAASDPHDDGTRTVFFELNGQPRPIRIMDRTKAPKRPAAQKAESGNSCHVGAPMPGTVVGIQVLPGKKVTRGDVLLVLETMKMETAVRAEREAVVQTVVTSRGALVDTKDLLIILKQ